MTLLNYYVITHDVKKLMHIVLNYAHNKIELLYEKNRPRKLVKRPFARNDDFLSYAVHARYGAHFEVSFAYLQHVSVSFVAQPRARKNYSSSRAIHAVARQIKTRKVEKERERRIVWFFDAFTFPLISRRLVIATRLGEKVDIGYNYRR